MPSTCPPPTISPFFFNRYIELFPFLGISLCLAALTDYIIWKKSDSLGTFKYYLLNQAISAQILEVLIIFVNPVLLTPYNAGLAAGIVDNFASYNTCVYGLAIGVCFFINVISSVFITLTNRFIFMFYPDSRRYLENKYTMSGIVIFHFVMYSFAFGIMISTMTSHNQTRFEAARDHPGAMEEYFKFNSFAYISGGELRYFLLRIGLGVAGCLVLLLLISVTFFIVNVFIYKKTATVISKTSKFLIVSSILQALICIVFLMFPLMWIVATWAWENKISGNVTNSILVLLSLHGTVDMIATLYFVVPYRKFCMSLVWKKKDVIHIAISTTILDQ